MIQEALISLFGKMSTEHRVSTWIDLTINLFVNDDFDVAATILEKRIQLAVDPAKKEDISAALQFVRDVLPLRASAKKLKAWVEMQQGVKHD